MPTGSTARVDGLDVFTIPFGPVRSGIFEAIQFQIETGGEDVARLQTRPFFKHRGIEQRFAGLASRRRRPRRRTGCGDRLERAYASAFSQAVERTRSV